MHELDMNNEQDRQCWKTLSCLYIGTLQKCKYWVIMNILRTSLDCAWWVGLGGCRICTFQLRRNTDKQRS